MDSLQTPPGHTANPHAWPQRTWPGGNCGDRWISVLIEHGFSYDSSMARHDYAPTWYRLGDVPTTDGPHRFGDEVDLVQLPFEYILDDWPYFSYDGPTVQGLRTPDHVQPGQPH